MPPIDRILFFGTPEFALPSLEVLLEGGRAPALVVSQPARRAGRGRRLTEPPVARRAREAGLELAQPESVRAPELLERLSALDPDLAIVVAFGQIFPKALLELPRLGCINVHASLLPRWRGAAPIAAVLAAGDAETGVSIQRMEEGLDSGPVLARRRLVVGEGETAGELGARLSRLGAELLPEVLEGLERGDLVPEPQDAALATRAPKLKPLEDLDRSMPAGELDRRIRARLPEPGAAIVLGRERVKLLAVRPHAGPVAAPPGTLVAVEGEALRLATGESTALDLLRVQRPGGRPISGRDLANGLRLAPGDRPEPARDDG